jgi:pimeloyl-ACP methyl ester carboxylesterase
MDSTWRLQDYVEWLGGQIGAEKVILLGHSFGGQLAVRFTSLHGARVEKLILIDSAGIRDRRIWKRIKRIVFFLLAKVGRPLAKIDPLRRVFYRSIREMDYFEASPPMRKTMVNVMCDEVVADFEQIKVPTLIIWGKRDKTTPVQHAYIAGKKIKNSSLAIIEDGRHSPQFTHASQVAELIREFVG